MARPSVSRSSVTGVTASGRELGSATTAPPVDDRTAGAGTHARAEPVLAGAAAVVRLEGALHAWALPEGRRDVRNERWAHTRGGSQTRYRRPDGDGQDHATAHGAHTECGQAYRPARILTNRGSHLPTPRVRGRRTAVGSDPSDPGPRCGPAVAALRGRVYGPRPCVVGSPPRRRAREAGVRSGAEQRLHPGANPSAEAAGSRLLT
jgi:hypothetical protein